MSQNWTMKWNSLISKWLLATSLSIVGCNNTMDTNQEATDATQSAPTIVSENVSSRIYIANSSISTASLAQGATLNSSVTLAANSATSNMYADIRIYNSANQQVALKGYKDIAIQAGGTTTVNFNYQAPSTLPVGTYSVHVGVWDQTTWYTYLYETRHTFQVVAPVQNVEPKVTLANSSISKSSLSAGEVQTVNANFTSNVNLSSLFVDVRVYNSANTLVANKLFDNVSLSAGTTSNFPFDYKIPSTLATGTYNVQVGVWSSSWFTYYYGTLHTFSVVAAQTTPTPSPVLSAIISNTKNLVVNPGFEDGVYGWNINWGGMSVVTSQGRNSSKALKIAPNGGTSSSFLTHHLVPGQTYRATVYGRQEVANDSGKFYVILRDGSGGTVFSKDLAVTTTGYQSYSIDFTMPSNAKEAIVQFYKYQGAGNMYIDDVEVVSTSHPVTTTYAYPSAAPAGGVAYPFGSHKYRYVAGILPTNVSQATQDTTVKNFYNNWKRTALSTQCGDYMVKFSHQDKFATVSEGIGYGMLITVLMAGYDPEARKIFDGLFKFSRKFPAYNSDMNLMSWAVKPDCTDGGLGWNAVDGDLDIAMALVMADTQWGSDGSINYMEEAVKRIRAMKLINFDYTGTIFAKTDMNRSSDNMLSHFRAFKKATGDIFWDTALVKGQENFEIGQTFSSVGLMPGFLFGYAKGNLKPSPGGMIESAIEGDYDWNACRNPWRLATDYIVSADPRTKAILVKLMDFFADSTGGDPTKIQPGYKLDGTPLDTWGASPSFVGPAAAGAMVDGSYQTFLNSLWSWNAAHPAGGYYDQELQLIPLIVVSGNWWQP